MNWFARHEHLLSFESKNATLRLEPGRPRELVSVVREDEARYAPDGDAARPTTFEAVVGQKEAVDRLRTFAQASRKSGRMPPPALILGESGLGKTTLARAYARELGARLKVIDTSTLENPLGLIRQLADLRAGDAVFLDEIHALPKALVECLYPAIEDGVMPIRFTDGIAIKTVSFVLPKIAWIAATTNPERMAEPFRGRFRMIELRPYAHDDLVEIIHRAAARAGRAIASEAAEVLAKAAGGNARSAIGLYAEARAHADARGGGSITIDDARNALRLAELDQNGIGPVHRRILDVLRWYGRPMAAQRLCSQVGITVKALRTIYEPALVRSGAVIPTPRGFGGSRSTALACPALLGCSLLPRDPDPRLGLMVDLAPRDSAVRNDDAGNGFAGRTRNGRGRVAVTTPRRRRFGRSQPRRSLWMTSRRLRGPRAGDESSGCSSSTRRGFRRPTSRSR